MIGCNISENFRILLSNARIIIIFYITNQKKNVPLLNRKQKLIAILDVCQAMLMITIKYPYTHYRERTTLPLFLRQFLWLNAQSSVLNEFFFFTQIVSTLISNLIAIKFHWKMSMATYFLIDEHFCKNLLYMSIPIVLFLELLFYINCLRSNGEGCKIFATFT